MSNLLDNDFYSFLQGSAPSVNFQRIASNISVILKQWEYHMTTNEKILTITTELNIKNQWMRQFQTKVRLQLTEEPPTMEIQFITLKNNKPLSVKSKYIRILLCSYFVKINSELQIFKFSICPFSGIAKFCVSLQFQSFCLKQLQNPLLIQRQKNIGILKKIEMINEVYEHHVLKIINLTNQGSFEEIKKNQQKKHFLVNDNYYTEIEEMNKILPITHQNFQKSIKDCLQGSRKQLKINPSVQKMIDLMKIQSKLQMELKNIFTTRKIQEYIKLQDSLLIKTHVDSSKSRMKVIFLKKHTIKQSKIINTTQSSIILMVQGNQYEKSNINGYIQFVKKEALTKKGAKNIQREQQVIKSLLKSGIKDTIAQYYEIKQVQSNFDEQSQQQNQKQTQTQYQKSLFLKLYPFTLSQYLQLNKESMSIGTKLTLLLKIQLALSQLHLKGYQHMDLKPDNILIDNRFNIKFIDFSQTVHPSLPLKEKKPGVSIPYSPNEFYSKYMFEPQRCDTYSFGVMMFEMIFGQLPICLPAKKQSVPQIYKTAQLIDNIRRFQPQKICEAVQGSLGKFIANLCIKCTQFDPKLRPCDQWLRVMLKKIKIILLQI